jgi:hypothetical protein
MKMEERLTSPFSFPLRLLRRLFLPGLLRCAEGDDDEDDNLLPANLKEKGSKEEDDDDDDGPSSMMTMQSSLMMDAIKGRRRVGGWVQGTSEGRRVGAMMIDAIKGRLIMYNNDVGNIGL